MSNVISFISLWRICRNALSIHLHRGLLPFQCSSPTLAGRVRAGKVSTCCPICPMKEVARKGLANREYLTNPLPDPSLSCSQKWDIWSRNRTAVVACRTGGEYK
ncbi:hypothetical protein CDAR_611571 [Caerostris darwini]|uniref:Secreted protein n=1 Tax=Caerostris darwini TaxID=1538125 RepID=A0AAV4U321_9ARAC|nr:hypothetical protein CDAR_611571 [Caerostris darwini]